VTSADAKLCGHAANAIRLGVALAQRQIVSQSLAARADEPEIVEGENCADPAPLSLMDTRGRQASDVVEVNDIGFFAVEKITEGRSDGGTLVGLGEGREISEGPVQSEDAKTEVFGLFDGVLIQRRVRDSVEDADVVPLALRKR